MTNHICRPQSLRPYRALPLLLLLLLLTAALALLVGCGNDELNGSKQQAPPPIPVMVVVIEPEDVELTGEYVGRVHGFREVEVRAQVAGILKERLHTEGQAVAEGDPLFYIDSEPFTIALQRAEGERTVAIVNLAQAQREWRRANALYEQGAISQLKRDQALTNRDLSEASLISAEAALADARRNLRHTEVRAPIGGFTGLETFPEGSLVESGALLANITNHHPVYIHFSLPENDGILLTRRLSEQLAANNDPQLIVRLTDGSAFQIEGKIDFIDRVLDPLTGTIAARAIFPNPNKELVPGQLVRVQLPLRKLEGVFMVNPTAIGVGSGNNRDGRQVFIVADDNTAQARQVEIGPMVAGRQVILSGLTAGERLVTNGQVALGHGMLVTIIPANEE